MTSPSHPPRHFRLKRGTKFSVLGQLAFLRQFTNQVSHDLRTPLSMVYGYLQSLLQRRPNLTLEQREALEIASAETQHTIEVLKTLLDEMRAQSFPALRINK